MLFRSDLKPGDTLGRYEILMQIARGGMAAVWAARMVGSRGFQKLVAIKTMLPDLSDDPDFEAMFLDEARLAARIRHPHAVEIVDLGDEDGCLYIVMEWIDGETIFTLNKHAKTKGGVPLPILLRIASSACAGLHAAHELRDDKGQLVNLVHRDISPQNVMVSLNGIVKLVDFGVAKAAGRAYETRVAGIMKGKVPYLSPEQLTTGKVDRRADIFGLGILIYAMASGFHPFRGETDAKTMENICTRAHVPLRELVPSIPADLEAAVDRCLAKDPTDRWPDCAALQRALDLISSSIGPPVTDGDVARFVRSTLGDVIEERRKRLAVAIQTADNRASTSAERRRTSGIRPAVRGGAPLPATYAGILPVALDDAGATPEPEPDPEPAAAPSGPASPAPTVPPTRRRRSAAPYVALAAALLLGGAFLAARAGVLPVPPRLRALLPGAGPPAGAPAPAPPVDAPAAPGPPAAPPTSAQ
ncbi:MAG: serine/threonine protein kinase [Polyangiaceae bacterium]|nr:serine/threonine protein kinase [Polyangiaceae bacterium]